MDFSQDIINFQRNGKFYYEFDEGGNLIFNSSSLDFNQHYISLPLTNYEYNNYKITSFYDLEFKEFYPSKKNIVETTSSLQMDKLTIENQQLKQQLDNLILSSNNNQSSADNLASKQVIVGLRIQLGEGSTEQDFLNEFPYFPVEKV